MKKIFTVGLTCLAVLFLGIYVYFDNDSTPTTNKQEHYEVPFENAKLIDEKIDGKTGIKVDVYTIEGWEK